MESFGELVMRTGKTLTALKLATGIPRDWNVPPALWSCGEVKAFLVISRSCALCTFPRAQVQHSSASVRVCAVQGGDVLPGVFLRQATAALSAGRTACADRVPGAAACLCWDCWELFLEFTGYVRTIHRWKEVMCLN